VSIPGYEAPAAGFPAERPVVCGEAVNLRDNSMSESTSTNIRHAFFILAGAVALVFDLATRISVDGPAGGNILNPVEFFGDANGRWRNRRVPQASTWPSPWLVFHGVGRLRQQADWAGVQMGVGIFVALSYIGVSMGVPCVSRHPVSGTSTSVLGPTN